MIGTITGLVSGIACSALYSLQVADVTSASLTWWQYLIISLCPTLMGIIGDIVLSILKNRNIVSSEDVEKIEKEIGTFTEKLEEEIKELKSDGKNEDNSQE